MAFNSAYTSPLDCRLYIRFNDACRCNDFWIYAYIMFCFMCRGCGADILLSGMRWAIWRVGTSISSWTTSRVWIRRALSFAALRASVLGTISCTPTPSGPQSYSASQHWDSEYIRNCLYLFLKHEMTAGNQFMSVFLLTFAILLLFFLPCSSSVETSMYMASIDWRLSMINLEV